jgi:hypothetical protein
MLSITMALQDADLGIVKKGKNFVIISTLQKCISHLPRFNCRKWVEKLNILEVHNFSLQHKIGMLIA